MALIVKKLKSVNEIIDNYKTKWNSFFEDWYNSPQNAFDNNIWSKSHKGKGKTELDPFSLPQPYLGNPKNCSVITLNLNPGPTSDLRIYQKGLLVQQFKKSENYFEYAKEFPQMKLKEYPSKFWNKQFKWIENLTDNNSNSKLPFAIEICPWHSKKWKSLKGISDELNSYIQENVFEVINVAIKFSSMKIVLSVGKTYYDLFGTDSLGFEKIIEITPENYSSLIEFKWPLNKKGELSKRFFSIWKHKETEILYLNSYSYGSNTPPSKEWNEIQNYLIKNYNQ